MPRTYDTIPVIPRFEAKILKMDGGCWRWTGGIGGNGYGNFHVYSDNKQRTFRAHRFSYELYIGPIPNGLQLDHLCRNRWCVNPAHLEVVTGSENVRRKPLLTHCRKGGHLFTSENTYIVPGRGARRCLACVQKRDANRFR